jgi:hypothetical protein
MAATNRPFMIIKAIQNSELDFEVLKFKCKERIYALAPPCASRN